MTVGQLSDCMSARELAEWKAFYDLEPFGEEWHQTGTIAAATWNVHLKPKDRVKPDVFIPKPEPDAEPEPDDDNESDAAELAKDQRLSAMMQALATRQNRMRDDGSKSTTR